MLKRPMSNHRRRAVTGIFVVVMIPVLFGFAALSIDLGSRAVVQSELQNAVDAAVLAGIQDLKGDPPDPDAAEAMVLDILARNVSYRQNGDNIAARTTVEFGSIVLDAMSGDFEFLPGAGWDALRVSVTSDQDYFFAALLGVFSTTVTGMASSGLMERPPVAMWRMGETVGTTAGDETGAHDGQHYGDVELGHSGVLSGNTAVKIGRLGTNEGRIEIPHSDDFLLDHGAVSLWFYTHDEDLRQGIFSKDSSGFDSGGHFEIGLVGARIQVRLQSATASYYLFSPTTINAHEWHHVVVSFGAGGMKLFFDGTQVDSDPYTGGLGTTSGGAGNYEPITIGVSQMGSGNQTSNGWYFPFQGAVDEVGLYNRGMTERDARWLYNSVQAGTVSNGAVVRDGLLRM